MAKFIQNGKTIDYAAEIAVAAGEAVKIGDNFHGVADRAIPAGATGALTVEGVYEFVADGAITLGSKVYLSSGKASATSADGACLGVAVSAAASGEGVLVKLNC